MKKTTTTLLLLFFLSTLISKAQAPPTFWGITQAHVFKWDTLGNYTIVYTGGGTGNVIRGNNGLLYGMFDGGGIHSKGLIFSYNIPLAKFTDLHDFTESDTDGAASNGSLFQANNGLLYGMTDEGGAYNALHYGDGVIFSYDISTGVETILHSFGDTGDGYYPLGNFIQASNGLLYGMTSRGGANDGGIIFSYNIATGTETDLFDFGALFENNSVGDFPQGSLCQVNDSLLIGMTQYGGAVDSGVLFSFNIKSGTENDLHDFLGGKSDGILPQGSVIKATNGLLYGIVYGGGLYEKPTYDQGGIIFSYNLSNSAYTVLHNFDNDTDAYYLFGSLIQARNGLLYGTSNSGGGGQFPKGTIFSYNITTGTENVVYTFHSNSGDNPFGDLLEDDPIYISPLSPNICNGSATTINAGGANTYTWLPATGLSATTGDSVIANPTATTVYTITGTDTAGWVSTITDTVNITPAPAIPVITISEEGYLLTSSALQGNQWYLNGTLIKGATQQTHKPSESGYYSVTVTDSITGCSSTSNSLYDTLEGIEQLSIENFVKVFPNPFNTIITLNINSSIENISEWSLQITDVLGRTLYTMTSLNYNNELDLMNLSDGIYFITVMNKTGRAVIPVVKQN